MYRLVSTALGAGLLLLAATAATAADALPDTRILIDVSGSMKQNDPKNLRRPALRLLVALLPSGSRAGVWSFAQYANMQVPLGRVDAQWRERARKGAEKVHSRGLYTHVEEALMRATEDWSGPAGDQARHLVLLTDGMVDVSKDPRDSLASRRRIIEQQLPRLREQGVRVHTVALSERADHELMRRLSNDTGGWYEQVQSADQLQKVFLRIFEKVGNPDSLPLQDNRFRVDESIREVTLIVFHAEGTAATRLVAPNGSEFGADAGVADIAWHRDDGYDLITIREPMAGDWRVLAQADPENRALVLTDLRMEVSELPSRVVVGQRLPVQVSFQDQGQTVTRREFIDVLTVSAEQVGPPGTETEPRPLRDDGQGDDPLAYDGRFEMRFDPVGQAGRGELVIDAEGRTFQREKRRLFELVAPARAELAPVDGGPTLRLRVTPDPEVVDAAAAEASAELTAGDGVPGAVPLARQPDGTFEAVLDPSGIAGTATLVVRVRARTPGGNAVGAELPPLTLRGGLEVAAPAPADPAPPDSAAAQPAPGGSGGMMLAFVIANLALLLAGGGAFWVWRRRRRQDPFQLVDPDETTPAAGKEQAA